MGSKTRRLRVAAGAAGLSYQADLRRAARAAARGAEPAVAPTEQAPAARGRLYPARIESVSIGGRRFDVVDSDVALAPAPLTRSDFERMRTEMPPRDEVLCEPFTADHMSPAHAIAAAGGAFVPGLDEERELAELRAALNAMVDDAEAKKLAAQFDADAAASGLPRVEAWRRGLRRRWQKPLPTIVETTGAEATSPPEPGMRRVNRAALPMALATLLAMASLGAVDDPKEEQ